jgi:hypothetical protein
MAFTPPVSEVNAMKIKILQQSLATMAAPGHCVRRGADRSPRQFETRRMSRADRRHASIGTFRCGLVERSF